MAEIKSQPSNKNFLSPFGYKFFVKKTPTTNWFVQAVNLPSVSISPANIPTPFINIPLAGDHITYGDFSVTFRLDEDMTNYMELFNWMQAIAFPEKFEQYKAIAPRINGAISGDADPLTGDSIYSDATVIIMSSAMNPLTEISFIDIFPTNLSQISFDSRLTDVLYVDATVSFAFRNFTVKSLN